MLNIVLSAIYFCFLLLLIIIAMYEPGKKHYIPVKMICSSIFLGLCIYHNYKEINNLPIIVLLLGILMCWLGDFFMGVYNKSRRKKYMGLGMGTFMLAHLAFLIMLYISYPFCPLPCYLIPLLSVPIMIITLNAFHIHMGRLRPLGIIYGVFVTAFMVKALSTGDILLCFAGPLFWASDFSLIFYYFYKYKNKSLERATQAFNLTTYYLAMLLLSF